jgi:fatty acid desaturase
MARAPLWEFVYLWSNLHLEHHYYPAVPFYRLPDLNTALVPFFETERVPARRYRDLLRGWIVENRAPHSDWSASASASPPAPAAPVT